MLSYHLILHILSFIGGINRRTYDIIWSSRRIFFLILRYYPFIPYEIDNVIQNVLKQSYNQPYIINILLNRVRKLNLHGIRIGEKRAIGEKGAIVLLNALTTNKTLQYLDLGWNNIGAEGIANALKTNKTLQVLNLEYNNIGIGAIALANALKTNKTLQKLYLWANTIGDKGAIAFANALKTNKTLQVLNLDSNKIGDKGAIALANALKTNKTLQKLYFWSNTIGDKELLP